MITNTPKSKLCGVEKYTVCPRVIHVYELQTFYFIILFFLLSLRTVLIHVGMASKR